MSGQFQLATESSVGRDRAEGESGGRVMIAGKVEQVVLDRRDDDFAYRLELGSLTAQVTDSQGRTVNGTDDPLMKELSRPVLVHLNNDGTPLGLRFDPATGHKAKTWLRGFVQAFRVTIPNETQDRWTVAEKENAGDVQVTYSVTERQPQSIELARSKSDLTLEQPHAQLQEYDCSAEARADLRLRWCDQVTVSERAVMTLDSLGMRMRIVVDGELAAMQHRGAE